MKILVKKLIIITKMFSSERKPNHRTMRNLQHRQTSNQELPGSYLSESGHNLTSSLTQSGSSEIH